MQASAVGQKAQRWLRQRILDPLFTKSKRSGNECLKSLKSYESLGLQPHLQVVGVGLGGPTA